MRLDILLALGFDNSTQAKFQKPRVGCSSCAPSIIQGVPCHEKGCRNEKHECFECTTLIDKGMRLCDDCANDEAWEAFENGDLSESDEDF